jgi:hypothetical protein
MGRTTHIRGPLHPYFQPENLRFGVDIPTKKYGSRPIVAGIGSRYTVNRKSKTTPPVPNLQSRRQNRRLAMQEMMVVTFVIGFALLRLALPVALLLLIGTWFGRRSAILRP